MTKKLTLEFVRKQFELQGCELLVSEYANNSVPLEFRCSCGTVSKISYGNFKKGGRCAACGVATANTKRRRDAEAVKDEFKQAGCELLSEYRNNYTPLRYRCSCGNESEIRLFAFQKGQRCRNCRTIKGDKHHKWNPDREAVKLLKTLQRRSRQLLAYSLKQTGQTKTAKKAYMLGYSPADLMQHLESFPNWTSLKQEEWHIDHVFPVKAFVEHGIDDIKLINCLDNLQPLPAKENLQKNDQYDSLSFHIWLQGQQNDRQKREA